MDIQQSENRKHRMDEQKETKSALLIMADRFYVARFDHRREPQMLLTDPRRWRRLQELVTT